jgi:hypothetical protein
VFVKSSGSGTNLWSPGTGRKRPSRRARKPAAPRAGNLVPDPVSPAGAVAGWMPQSLVRIDSSRESAKPGSCPSFLVADGVMGEPCQLARIASHGAEGQSVRYFGRESA